MKTMWSYLVAAACAIAAPCYAQDYIEATLPGEGPPPFPPPFPHNEVSDVQLDELMQDKKDFLRNDAVKQLQIQELRLEITEQMSQPTLDKAKILDLNSKISALKNELSVAEINRQIKRAEAMTPEQRKRFKRMAAMRPPGFAVPGMSDMPFGGPFMMPFPPPHMMPPFEGHHHFGSNGNPFEQHMTPGNHPPDHGPTFHRPDDHSPLGYHRSAHKGPGPGHHPGPNPPAEPSE